MEATPDDIVRNPVTTLPDSLLHAPECFLRRGEGHRTVTAAGGSLARSMALNPVVFTEKVLQSFLRYQLRAYPFADPRLHGQMRELLSLDEARESPLLQGPFVSLSRPFRGGAAVADLAPEGLLHPHLQQRIPSDVSQLYRHQEKAIRAIVGGRSTLVSTGTGSGKTECFL